MRTHENFPGVIGFSTTWYVETMLCLGARRRWGPLTVLLATVTLASGCGGDLFGGLGDDGDDDSGDDGAGNETEGPGDDTSGDDDGNGDGALSPDCGDTFCEGVGTCIEAEGQFYCECDEGYVPQGNTCEPCNVVDASAFEVNIEVVRYAGDLRIDGTTTNTSVYDRGRLVAVNVRTLDEVEITTTRNGNFDVGVVPGVYDLYYEFEQGGLTVPRNEHAHLGTVAILESTTREVIDLRPRRVTGDIAVNGTKLNTSVNDRGTIAFENTETGDIARVGTTETGSYDALVLPGTYDVYYELITGGASVPVNTHGLVATGIEVPEGPDDPSMAQAVDIDVDMTVEAIAGDIRINGSTPPASNYDDGNLWLRSDDGRDRVYIGSTRDGAYAANVLVGDYTVEYGLESGGVTVPRNSAAPIEAFEVSGTPHGEINILAVTVSGDITLNGAPPSSSAYDDGRVWLATAEGDQAALGVTSDGNYSALVVPGSYELRYGVESAGATVPRNTNALLTTFDVGSGSATLDVDIPAVAVNGDITVAGQAPPGSVYESARILMRTDDGDALELARTHDTTFDSIIIPGTYDFTYVEDGAPSLPANRNGRIGEPFEIAADATLNIDVPVVSLAGTVSVNDAAPPATTTDSGRIYLERRAERDTVFITSTDTPNFTSEILPGQYDVYYRVEQSGGTVPNNQRARLTCVQVE